MLFGEAERHLRGGENADAGRIGQQGAGDAGHGAAHMLAVIEDEDGVAGAQIFGDEVQRLRAGAKRHGEGLDQHAFDEFAGRDRGEVDHPDAALGMVERTGHRDRQSGLAHPARADNADEPVLADQLADRGDLGFARDAIGAVAADIAAGAGTRRDGRRFALARRRANILVSRGRGRWRRSRAPSALRSADIWTRRVFSSTMTPGQTASNSSPLSSSCSRRSSSARSRSNERARQLDRPVRTDQVALVQPQPIVTEQHFHGDGSLEQFAAGKKTEILDRRIRIVSELFRFGPRTVSAGRRMILASRRGD